jgi:hypothetical protein
MSYLPPMPFILTDIEFEEINERLILGDLTELDDSDEEEEDEEF